MKNAAQAIEDELVLLKNDEKAVFLQVFFKTGKGQYAEGDKLLGIEVPTQRKIAKAYYKGIELTDIAILVQSPWHECRLTALIMLVMKMEKEKSTTGRQAIVDLYLDHLVYVNNWDLVDISAPYILGRHLIDAKDKSLLYEFADSGGLWKQRIAIIATLYFIRNGHYETSLLIAEKLVYHEHDLIHKAVGWVLRELGKKDEELEKEFLDRYYKTMPRTMLRYAIERFAPDVRKHYMGK